MKKAMISISGICANVGITNLEYIDVYISIVCSIIICIATLIAMFKHKNPKEIEIKQNEEPEQPPVKEKTIEEQIIETAHNIQDLINKKGGDK
ncbi:MAG: hypothetical protein II238_02800 [Alphaproteobacteria bacterium]|nr:hypothetical protein [Alphaproteobacteria bacterium]